MMLKIKKISIGCMVFGVFGVLLALACLVVLPIIVRNKVVETVAIKKGTPTYPQFIEPTIPIYMQIYVFDLINEDEVLQGAKPYVVERGPYTYREHRVKFDLQWNNSAGLVKYKQNRTFFFDRSMSVGPDTDVFTTANLPLLTLMFTLRNSSGIFNTLISNLLKGFPEETLFIKKTVYEMVWGYTDDMLKAAHDLPFIGKRYIPTDFIGILTGTNATYDGLYNIVTGVKDPAHLGQIMTFNNSIYLPYWKTKYANLVNGSDGTLCPPFLNKSSILPIFVSDICRSVYGVYKDTTKTKQGISIYRFTAPPEEMANATINPDNIGFCVRGCLPSGLIDLSTCKVIDGLNLPVVASYPHFLDGDPSLVEAIGGLRPDPEWHRTYTNMEPTSGIVMEAFKRLQINVKMDKIPGFARFGNIRSMFYPILWLNESAVVDDELANQVSSMLIKPVEIAHTTIYVLIFIFSLLLLIGCFIFIRAYRLSMKVVHVQSNASENDVLLNNGGDVQITDENR